MQQKSAPKLTLATNTQLKNPSHDARSADGMSVDNREDLRLTMKQFEAACTSEGVCSVCGLLTLNPCQTGTVTTFVSDWPPHAGVTNKLEPSVIRLVVPMVAKTKGFYCSRGRMFATTLLARREFRNFVAYKMWHFVDAGGSYQQSNGDPLTVTESLIDDAFEGDEQAARRKNPPSVDEPWDDELTEEEAWVSHWRRRSLEGAVRISPQARVLMRIILFDAAWRTPVVELPVVD